MNRRPLNSLRLGKAITGFANYKTAGGLDAAVLSAGRVQSRYLLSSPVYITGNPGIILPTTCAPRDTKLSRDNIFAEQASFLRYNSLCKIRLLV